MMIRYQGRCFELADFVALAVTRNYSVREHTYEERILLAVGRLMDHLVSQEVLTIKQVESILDLPSTLETT